MPEETPRHALVWITKDFLESEGMLRILEETGMMADRSGDWEKVVEAAENTGGFALTGTLTEIHGPGIWIASPVDPGIQMLIPWHFIRCVVTAQEHPVSRMMGLMASTKVSPKP